MDFKFIRPRTIPSALTFPDVVEAVKMQDINQFKCGYLACYSDLVEAPKYKNISTLVDLQDVMGTLARKGKSL